jgi:hypothetical protein
MGRPPFSRNRRPSITKDTRERVLERDGYACVACGEAKRGNLDVDHIVPVSYGGNSLLGNLQTLCRACNREKGWNMTATAWRKVHPELRLEDLEFEGLFIKVGRGEPKKVRWCDGHSPVRVKDHMRTLLVPAEHLAEVMAFLDRLRG